MSALEKAVDALLAPGDLATAVTIIAETPDARIERAFGTRNDGRPSSADDLACIYCAGKPVLALAALVLVEEGRVALDGAIGAHLPWLASSWVGELTLHDLLNQNTNLHRVGAVLPMATVPARRAEWLLGLERSDEPRAYADFGTWFLLAHLVEAVAREDFRDFTLRRVIEPFGIDERALNLGIPPELFAEWLPSLSLNVYSREEGVGLHALAAEGARVWACEWNPPFSTYGSTRGLVRFYRAVLDDIAGATRVLPAARMIDAVTAREPYHDTRLRREVSFGLGFMTDMSLFRLGPHPSRHSFGHVGVGGGSVGWADPEHDLAAAVTINAVFDEDLDLIDKRSEIVSAVYEELGLVSG